MKRELLTESETFHLEIPADENNLSEVRDFISDICFRVGFSKRETNNTKLAMDEACTNIIKHAYHEQGGVIRIDVQAEPGKVEISIFDRGEAFDWSKIEDPDLQQYVEIGKKGGLGIFLMNRLMDDIDYRSSEAGNRLYMVKSSAGAAVARPGVVAVRPRWTSTLRFKFGLRAGLGLLGLVVFLWVIQFMNQTREIEVQRNAAWMGMRSFAKALETRSENALVLDDIYDPEYRKVTDFILERIDKQPAVLYARIVNNDGIIVCSNEIDEFFERYDVPPEVRQVPVEGDWREIPSREYGGIKELHLPIQLSAGSAESGVVLGRVVLGVSTATVEKGISDPRPKTALILLGIFLVGLSLIYLLISVLVKPIQALTDGVRAIGEGSLDDEIRIEGPKEIGEIARAFNEITAKFRQAQKNVVEQERLQKEMQVAQEIQQTLLPKKVPRVSGYDIGSLYRAAKEVGGDYFDFVNVDDDTTGVVVADVSGKGVPGSLVMTMIRTALRMEARGNFSAAEVMARMNDFVTEDMKKGMFVTIFYVILDSKNRIISYASAGHNPMILYRAESDETFFLNPRGFPVGISLPDDTLFRRSIDVEKIKLKKDDMLVIYTDGVTEAMNEDREQYGEERLIRLIKRYGRLAPEEFIDRLNEDIAAFTGNMAQNDDITVVAIKEKLMADDVLFGIRKRLLDLVDLEGLSVAEACARMKVSPSTYYRYRRRLLEMGERGLKNKTLRKEHEIRRVNLEQRKGIIEIIKRYPQYGAKRIAKILGDGHRLTPSLIYDELKRMRLNTYERRLEYLRRNRIITDDEYESLLASPIERFKPGEVPAVEPGRIEAPEPLPAGAEAEELIPVSGETELVRSMDIESEDAVTMLIETRELEGGIVVLTVRGPLDSSSASEFEGFLESIYEYGYRMVIVDLEDVSYISSGGWGIFIGRVKQLREGEGDVVLVGMSPEVYDIYELLGFQDIIMDFQNVDEAVEYLSLPFEARQDRLEQISRARAEEVVLEHRITEVGPTEIVGEEGQAVWTPLRIEAGTVGEHGEITVLYLNGLIDTVSCSSLRSIMDDLIGQGKNKLVVDMSGVEYVSSSGWGVFASRINDIRREGGDIKIFGMDQEVGSIFHMLGFDTIMRSFSILAEAITDFEHEAPSVGEAAVSEAVSISGAATEPVQGGYEAASTTGSVFEPTNNLEITISHNQVKGLIIQHIQGVVDACTTAYLEAHLERCMDGSYRYLLLDCAGMVYISSSGWGVIIKYVQRFSEIGGTLAITGMSQPIFRIFRDLGFEPLIRHFLDVDKAIEEIVSDEHRRDSSQPGEADEKEGDEKYMGKKGTIRLEKTDIEPLTPRTGEQMGDSAAVIDFDNGIDLREDKDKKIRETGWEDYGRKLAERDREQKRRKK
ncbi:MAG: anti-sigma factor antagonist [bacterium]|nr:MAG: anti-sigma factor antagonist [bacterium]